MSISLLRYQDSSNWYTDSMRSPSQSLCRNWQDDFIYMKIQIRIATIVLGKKRKRLILPDFKTYYKTTIIKTVLY